MDETVRDALERLSTTVEAVQQRLDQLEARLAMAVPAVGGESAARATIPEEGLERAAALGKAARERQLLGLIEYYGSFSSNGRRAIWASEHSADALLEQDDQAVSRVLAALGNPQRLQILKAILRKPRTAAELVRDLELGTTGQVYHHLRPLMAADLIRPADERGVYEFVPHRVQALILLLAGAQDALDTRYSKGEWNAPQAWEAGAGSGDPAEKEDAR